MSGLLDMSLGRLNIALFALVTAFFGAAKMDCPSCLQCGPFGRQFFFPPPAASGTFLRVKGALDTATPWRLWHQNARCPAPRIM